MNRYLKIIVIIAVFMPFAAYFSLERNNPALVVEKQTKKTTIKQQKTVEPIEILFVGDIMLDRGVANHAEKHGVESLFSKVRGLFAEVDAVVGNLEGPITNEQSIARKDNSILRFTFDPQFAGVLKDIGFSAVSLANNHALDFGGDGYAQTLSYLQDAGLYSFGSYRNDQNISTSIKVKDKNLCLVGYHDLFTYNPVPVTDEITRIRWDCDFVVLFAHWGEEYQSVQTERQTELAHSFIDAGADLVIGAHPHVVQPVEIYKNKAIFYSLGNFMFDQDFSFETRHGLAVRVGFDENKTVFTLIPVSINKAEVQIADGVDADRVINDAVGTGGTQFVLWK